MRCCNHSLKKGKRDCSSWPLSPDCSSGQRAKHKKVHSRGAGGNTAGKISMPCVPPMRTSNVGVGPKADRPDPAIWGVLWPNILNQSPLGPCGKAMTA